MESASETQFPWRLAAFHSARIIAELARCCEIGAHTRILDLGCGDGRLLSHLAREYGVKGVGIDARADAILAARRLADEMGLWGEVTFSDQDVAAYPEAFHAFQIVLARQPLTFSRDLRDAVERLRVALADQAWLVLGASYPDGAANIAPSADRAGDAADLPELAELIAQVHDAGALVTALLAATEAEQDDFVNQRWAAADKRCQSLPDVDARVACRDAIMQEQAMYYAQERGRVRSAVLILRA
jgi:SAM-dependent methyltransferase